MRKEVSRRRAPTSYCRIPPSSESFPPRPRVQDPAEQQRAWELSRWSVSLCLAVGLTAVKGMISDARCAGCRPTQSQGWGGVIGRSTATPTGRMVEWSLRNQSLDGGVQRACVAMPRSRGSRKHVPAGSFGCANLRDCPCSRRASHHRTLSEASPDARLSNGIQFEQQFQMRLFLHCGDIPLSSSHQTFHNCHQFRAGRLFYVRLHSSQLFKPS